MGKHAIVCIWHAGQPPCGLIIPGQLGVLILQAAQPCCQAALDWPLSTHMLTCPAHECRDLVGLDVLLLLP